MGSLWRYIQRRIFYAVDKVSRIRYLILGLLFAFVISLSRCSEESMPIVETKTYLNHNDTVKYVGIETCKKCHYDKYQTFIKTGMGASFGKADTTKSIAEIDVNSILHDSYLDLNYHAFWDHDKLYVNEFRNNKGDTSYQNVKEIDFVIGSGQHTNSHLYETHQYLFQAPFTWYAQDGKLDFPPGFEDGNNSRFNRIIGLECTSCHNEMPTEFVMGSENKFSKVPGAINCERCHGPGEAHVKKIQRGDLTDTSKYIDYSIVNPKKLSNDLQFQICQRCHLQGNAVLAEGKTFFDFKPGMHLSEVMDVYLPRFTNTKDKFIMASHVDRFKASECFKQSEDYTCTSCHNPHISVKETNTIQFNNKCNQCHNQSDISICSAAEEDLIQAENNCVSCHMPSSSSTDIPHVSVHDHFVRRPDNEIDTVGVRRFLNLVAVNNEKPGNRSKALAYMQQYERFNAVDYLLDSALFFLYKYDSNKKNIILWTQYYYLKTDYRSIVKLTEKFDINRLENKGYNNTEAWTAYRIGEAYAKTGEIEIGSNYYKKAMNLAPFVPDFANKYGSSLISLDRLDEAINLFVELLKESPSHREGLNNLGYCYLKNQNLKLAETYFVKALRQDPDYKLAWLNLANVYLLNKAEVKLDQALREVLRIDPNNITAQQILNQL